MLKPLKEFSIQAKDNPLFTQILLGLSLSLIGAILYDVAQKFHWQSALAAVLCVLLTVVVIQMNVTISKLSYLITRRQVEASDPFETLLNDLIRSMQRYGFVSGEEDESEIRSALKAGQYIRGEHFYKLLAAHIPNCESHLLTMNDHPFTPFSDLVRTKAPLSIENIIINAVPDELYSPSDLQKRLDLLKRPNLEYFLLPAKDVHVSLLIFDARAVLVYTTPTNRTVCDFSEALLFSDSRSTEVLTKLFRHVEKFARRWTRANKISVAGELQSRIRLDLVDPVTAAAAKI